MSELILEPDSRTGWADESIWPEIWSIIEPHMMASRPPYNGKAFYPPGIRTKITYVGEYPYQITFLSTHPTGKAELDRVLEGDGEWFFFAKCSGDSSNLEIIRWHLVDLVEFRRLWKLGKLAPHLMYKGNVNARQFAIVDLWRAPRSLIIASSEERLDPFFHTGLEELTLDSLPVDESNPDWF